MVAVMLLDRMAWGPDAETEALGLGVICERDAFYHSSQCPFVQQAADQHH